MNFKKNIDNAQTALYGRARRIELAEKIAYVVVGIVAIALVFIIVNTHKEHVDNNVNFSMLRDYLEGREFRCEMIQMNGGSCVKKSENNEYTFIRFDSGFEYIVKSDGYSVDIRWGNDEKGDFITLKTTASALAGYKNNFYNCSYKDNILNEIDKCIDVNEKELDSKTYISVINSSMYDLNAYISHSGYRKDVLLENHEWSKK